MHEELNYSSIPANQLIERRAISNLELADYIDASKIVQDILNKTVNFKYPEFVEIINSWVFIDLSKISSKQEFKDFIDRYILSGNFFEGLDYNNFISLLHDDSVYTDNNGSKIKLANGVKKISDENQQKYERLVPGDEKASFTFDSDFYDGKKEFDLDEFIYFAWLRRVKYGLQIDRIRKALSSRERGKIIIAIEKKPENSTDAEIIRLVANDEDFTPIEQGRRVDFKTLKRPLVQVDAGVQICKKKPYKVGKNGWSINGEAIHADMPKDLNLDKYVGEGTELQIKNGEEFIVSTRKGFFGGGVKKVPFFVGEQLTSEGNIGSSTGNIKVLGCTYELKGNIDREFSLVGNTLIVKGNVDGAVFSKGGEISINGNVNGGGSKHCEDKQGCIKNSAGNIVIRGNIIQRARIEALKGKVDLRGVNKVEQSLVIGDEVELESANFSIIIGNTVRVKKAKNCFILGSSIEVGNIEESNRIDVGNMITIVVKALSKVKEDIINTKKQLQEKVAELTELQGNIEGLIKELDNKISLNPKKFSESVQTYLIELEKAKAAANRLPKGSNKAVYETLKYINEKKGKVTQLLSLLGEKNKLTGEVRGLKEKLVTLGANLQEVLGNMSCTIGTVNDNCTIRTYEVGSEEVFTDESLSGLIKIARSQDYTEGFRLVDILYSEKKGYSKAGRGFFVK